MSPPASWGSLHGEERKWYLLKMVSWKHIQAPSIATDSQPHVVLRYINSVKENSFQRRACSYNFSQNCEENTVGMTLVCMCACLSSSFCLQHTQDLSAKEIWLAGQERRHRNRPIFHVFHSNCTAVGIETKIK